MGKAKIKPDSEKVNDGRRNNTAPFKDIDWNSVRKLCAIHCKRDEIAAFLDVDPSTLTKACKRVHGMTIAEYMAIHRGVGKISVRRKQFQLAEEGNVTMCIWLGKQWLEQTDKVESKVENTTPSVVILPSNGREPVDG